VSPEQEEELLEEWAELEGSFEGASRCAWNAMLLQVRPE